MGEYFWNKSCQETRRTEEKWKNRFDISLKQVYVDRVTEMLNNSTIPSVNSDIIPQLILGKTRAAEVNWSTDY